MLGPQQARLEGCLQASDIKQFSFCFSLLPYLSPPPLILQHPLHFCFECIYLVYLCVFVRLCIYAFCVCTLYMCDQLQRGALICRRDLYQLRINLSARENATECIDRCMCIHYHPGEEGHMSAFIMQHYQYLILIFHSFLYAYGLE